MTEATHRPRLWHAYKSVGGELCIAVDSTIPGPALAKVSFIHSGWEDAYKMAAAPEMFDALEEVVKHGHNMNCPYGNRFAWDNDKCFCGVAQAESAIAKAKGETR